MRKAAYVSVLLVAVVPLVGCGKNADSLITQQIADINQLADALESGAEQSKIEALTDRMNATVKALEDLSLSQEEKNKLTEKHGAELLAARTRLTKAMASRMGGMMKGMAESLKGNLPAMPNFK